MVVPPIIDAAEFEAVTDLIEIYKGDPDLLKRSP